MWRLYDELMYGNERLNQNSKLECGEFKTQLEEIKSILSTKEVAYIERKNRNLGYFIIEPDGNIFVPMISKMKDTKKYIGNIQDDSFKGLIERWEGLCNSNNHIDMIESIFKEEATDGA